MTMFNELLAIKQFREQQAELAFMRQRRRRVAAEQETEKARNRLDRFREWAQAREQSMYAGLCERVVRVREIETVLQEVAQLRQDEISYESILQKADEALDQEIKVLGECRQTHMQAMRMRTKFVELATAYEDDLVQLQNNQEDQELEEVASRLDDRLVWLDGERAR